MRLVRDSTKDGEDNLFPCHLDVFFYRREKRVSACREGGSSPQDRFALPHIFEQSSHGFADTTLACKNNCSHYVSRESMLCSQFPIPTHNRAD